MKLNLKFFVPHFKGGIKIQYFIGIVPPEKYKNQIVNLQQNWKHHKIIDAVEPHLTLKSQGGLTPDKKWISKVKNVCDNFLPFDVSINTPKYFGEDILYLSAESAELFNFHTELVHAISPSEDLIKKYFELEDFTPHITLGKTFYGLSKKELIGMEKMAKENLTPYPTFKVEFIRIYQEGAPGKYIPYLDVQLKI